MYQLPGTPPPPSTSNFIPEFPRSLQEALKDGSRLREDVTNLIAFERVARRLSYPEIELVSKVAHYNACFFDGSGFTWERCCTGAQDAEVCFDRSLIPYSWSPESCCDVFGQSLAEVNSFLRSIPEDMLQRAGISLQF